MPTLVCLRKNVMRVTNTVTIFAFAASARSTELRFERLIGIKVTSPIRILS